MRHDAPVKLAIRDQGEQGINVYLTKNEPGMEDAMHIMSMHPGFARVPGIHPLFLQFVKDAGKLLIESVVGEGTVKAMEERVPPAVN